VVNERVRAIVVPLALSVTVLVTACSTVIAGAPVPRDGAIPALPESAPETTTTTKPAPLTNERGFVPKELGENSCYGPADSANCGGGVTFSIDKIVVDPPCAEFGQRSRHTLVLSLRVATGTDSASIQDAGVVFNPYSFLVIGKNGVSQKAEFGICTDVTSNPVTYGPNQKYAFQLELDVPVAHGTLALQPGIVGEDGTGGWEWPF
jgi:hypothetical protein